MPVDPGNLLVLGRLGGKPVHRRAGLRPQPQGERLRLGARPADRRHRRHRRRHRRHGRRRAADGDPDPAAAARDAAGQRPPRRSTPSCWPPAARAAWAVRTSCWRCSTASRWCGAPPRRALASRGSGTSSWSPAIRPSACARRWPGSTSGVAHNPRFRRRPGQFAEGRHRGAAAGCRRRADHARRHAGRHRRRSRPADRAFRKAGGTAIVRATHDGKRGNPVILPRALFPAVAQLEGDTGARHMVEAEG